MALVMVVVKRSQKYFVAQQNLGYVNGHIEEVYGGHNVMKAFNAEEQVIEEFNKINGELYDSAEIPVFIGDDDADHGVYRKFRICGSFHSRWMAGGKKSYRSRGYSVLYSIHKKLYPAG